MALQETIRDQRRVFLEIPCKHTAPCLSIYLLISFIVDVRDVGYLQWWDEGKIHISG